MTVFLLTFEGYEEEKMSLEEYLRGVVFYQERSFSRKALTAAHAVVRHRG